MNKVTVTIQGSNYTMVGEKSEKEILRISNYVNNEMDKLKQSAPNLGSLQVSILTSLNIADILFECSSENEDLLKKVDELEKRVGEPSEEMQAKIDELLDSLNSKDRELLESKFEIERLNTIISEQQDKIDSLGNVTEGNQSEIDEYKSELEALRESVETMTRRAEVAEDLSSQWQNKFYDLQLEKTELENKLAGAEQE